MCQLRSGFHVVITDPGLAEILLSWYRQTRYSGREDWVFASPFMDGRLPYRSWGIQQRHLKPAGIKAGLRPPGWHNLRRTYRTRLDETGAPISGLGGLCRFFDNPPFVLAAGLESNLAPLRYCFVRRTTPTALISFANSDCIRCWNWSRFSTCASSLPSYPPR